MKNKPFYILAFGTNDQNLEKMVSVLSSAQEQNFEVTVVDNPEDINRNLIESNYEIILAGNHPDAEDAKIIFKHVFDNCIPTKLIRIIERISGVERILAVKNGYDEVVSYSEYCDEDLITLLTYYGRSQRKKLQKWKISQVYQLLVDNLGDGAIVTDNEEKISYANPRMAEMLGLESEKVIGQNFLEFCDNDSRKKVQEELVHRSKGKSSTYNIITNTDEGRNFNIDARPWYDHRGIYSGTISTLRDVTQSEKDYSNLKENVNLYRILSKNIPDTGVALFDLNMRLLLVEGAMINKWNIDNTQIIGMPVNEVIPPKYLNLSKELCTLALDGKEFSFVREVENSFFEIQTISVRNDDGDIVAGMIVGADISDSEEAKRRLLRANREWEKTFDAVPDMLIVFDSKMRILKINTALIQKYGSFSGGFFGKRVEDLEVNPEFNKMLEIVELCLTDGRSYEKTVTVESMNTTLHAKSFPLYLKDDSVESIESVLLVVRDITSTVMREEHFRTQRKLGQWLSATNNVEEALNYGLGVCIDLVGVPCGAVFRWDDNKANFYTSHSEGFTESLELNPLRWRGIALFSNDFDIEKAVFPLPDLLQEEFDLLLADRDCQALALVPIKYRGTVKACYLLTSDKEVEIPKDCWHSLNIIITMIRHALGRIEADEEKHLLELRQQHLVHASPAIIYTAKPGSVFKRKYISDNVIRQFGYEPEIIAENPDFWIEKIHPEDMIRVREEFKNIGHKEDHSQEYRFKRSDGSYAWIRDELKVVYDEKSKISDIVGYCVDISEYRRIENALQSSEANIKAILNNSPQFFVLLDSNGRVKAFNHISEEGVRWKNDASIEKDSLMIDYIPDVLEKEYKRSLDAAFGGVLVTYERQLLSENGEESWFEMQYIPVRGNRGNVRGIILSILNINERRIIQDALERSEQRFRSLVQNSSDIIAIFDKKGNINFETQRTDEVFGRRSGSVFGLNICDNVHPEDKHKVEEAISKISKEHDRIESLEFRILKLDGKWGYIESVFHNRIDDPMINGNVAISRDISLRRKREEQLNLLAKAISTAEESVIITNAAKHKEDSKIVFVNEGFSRMTGYTSEEIIGKPPFMLLGPQSEMDVVENTLNEIIEGISSKVESTMYKKDGTKILTEMNISPVYDYKNEMSHIVAIQRDISEQKASEKKLLDAAEELSTRNIELETARRSAERTRAAIERGTTELRLAYEDAAEARMAAEQASEAKSQFLANMSHEIRTPMTAILGFAKLFREKTMDSKSRNFTEQIISSGEHLLNLINDILDLSRVESGRVVIDPTPYDIRELLEEMVDLYKPLAERKNIKLKFGSLNIPPRVILDRGRTRQIVSNLLNNALKFIEEGEVELRVVMDLGVQGIIISVSDTGPGIPKDQQKKIFEPFYQSTKSDSKVYEGSGLGLAITSRLVKAMGGIIELESEKNKLTTFIVHLPCEFTTGETKGKITEFDINETESSDISNLKVLVADDHQANRTLISYILEQVGCTVVVAEDGKEAVEAFRNEAFDIIVLDVQMPVMDGYEALRRIRALPGGSRIPILTLTAYAMRGDRERFLAIGADDYLSKPFDPQELIKRIRTLSNQELGGKSILDRQDPALDELRKEFLHHLIDEAEDYLKDLPDHYKLTAWGHTIAGSGGSFGYHDISAMGRMLEQLEDGKYDDLWAHNIIGKVLRSACEALEVLDEGQTSE
jgi:PAS domain S-box-containing protein